MLKVLSIALAGSCCLLAITVRGISTETVPAPARYESFENGVPATWVLRGAGKLSINSWHYKLDKKSLQWDFEPGDKITINNSIGNTNARGGVNNYCFAAFGIWIYSKKAMPGKNLRFEFRINEKPAAHFDFSLNFKGWQAAFPRYCSTTVFNRAVPLNVNNILIKAPPDTKGTVLIDCVIYNGLQYGMIDFCVRKTPWQPPDFDKTQYPVPDGVNEKDQKAIEEIKLSLAKVKITDTCQSNGLYGKLMKLIDNLDIVEGSHGIRGKPIQAPRWHSANRKYTVPFFSGNGISADKINMFDDLIILGSSENQYRGIFNNTIKCLNKGITQKQYEALCSRYFILWKYLLDQGFNTSYGYANYYCPMVKICIIATYLCRKTLSESTYMKDVKNYLQYDNFPFFAMLAPVISMDYFRGCGLYLYSPFLYSNDKGKQLQALRFLGKKLSREITGDYGACGFKPDGTGYHCTNFSVDYMIYGLRGIAKVAKTMSHSSFAISEDAFNTLKRVALRLYFYSNNCELPIFMQGTSPFGWKAKVNTVLPCVLKNLAMAENGGVDKELAQAYVNVNPKDTSFAEKYDLEQSISPQGNITMPYAPLVAQRRSGWVAIAWGGGVDMRQRGNHYMYHGGNGPLSILGKDGFFASGNQEAGWDWNRTNGTTCLYMPDITSIKYIHSGRKVPDGKKHLVKLMDKQYRTSKDDPLIKRGNGGISWRGINGCFRKIFRGDNRYNDFGGIKSYFFIDSRIYALGSNIKSDNKKYHVQTNLYQKVLKTRDAPIFVDGGQITRFPLVDKLLNIKKAHYLIDPAGNGYFIPAGQKLFIARKHQNSRDHKSLKNTAGYFATAWLEHGVKCNDGKYAYVIMPYCDKKKFAKFSAGDFEVLQQDDKAHILHDRIDEFYAGIFFRSGGVTSLPYVKHVERDCQIMYKEKDGKLQIAVGDPDPHRNWTSKLPFGAYGGKSELTPLRVTFLGKWKLVKPVDGVQIISADKNKTVIEFGCIHGKSFNFTLTR